MQGELNKDIYVFKKSIDVCENEMQVFLKYIMLLDEYQKKVNLIGKSTRDNIWVRHILDSAQILKLLPKENNNDLIIDIGSGAGFPGIVLTILGRKDIVLCEKNQKKVSFLNAAAQECKLQVKIFKGRVENYNNINIKIIVSRAVAPLNYFLKSIKHLTKPDTILVIHKGEKYLQELEEASKYFSFSSKCYDSITNPLAKIIKIKNIVELNEY